MNNREKNVKHNFTTALLLAVAIALFIVLGVSVYKIYFWQKDSSQTEKNATALRKNVEAGEVNFTELKRQNPDTVAWLTVPGTKIDYPVVQARDNDFYLTHSFDKTVNQAGWVFADFRNNFKELSQNTIIYGHAYLSGVMFGTLKDTLGKPWYSDDNNHYLTLTTENAVTTWKVFSVYHISTTDDYLETSFNNETEVVDFVNLVKGRSVHDFKTPSTTAKILTLSTCYTSAQRVVLHAVLVK